MVWCSKVTAKCPPLEIDSKITMKSIHKWTCGSAPLRATRKGRWELREEEEVRWWLSLLGRG